MELESREQCFEARTEPRVSASERFSGLSAGADLGGFSHAGEDADVRLVYVSYRLACCIRCIQQRFGCMLDASLAKPLDSESRDLLEYWRQSRGCRSHGWVDPDRITRQRKPSRSQSQ